MNDERESSPPDRATLVAAVEAVLASRFEQETKVTSVSQISDAERRNLLLRCALAPGAASAPSTVIVKQVLGAYDLAKLESWDTLRFLRELCGGEFLDVAAPDGKHLPRFYGGSAELGFVVLGDLGTSHGSLVEPLLDQDAVSAERALFAFMTRLAGLHADCGAALLVYDRIASGLGPAVLPAICDLTSLPDRADKLCERLAALVALPTLLREELHDLLAAIADPGALRTFVHGDCCPDNVFYSGDELRLIDLEFARPGFALLDAVYPRMCFPTCWCANRVPEELVSRLEGAYRAELAKRCAVAADDELFDSALVDACGYWVFITLEWLLSRALSGEENWGIGGIRQRILARLESFAATAQRLDRRPALRELAERLIAFFERSWPEVQPLPLYPAFR
jgi:hypothetical protein